VNHTFYKRSLLLFFLFSLLSGENKVEMYEEPYHDRILYLHPLLNYVPPIEWYHEWEQNRFTTNSVYISTGSVTTDDLLIDGRVTLNQDLGSGWWFRGQGQRYESRHLYQCPHAFFMGFDKKLYRQAYIFLLINPCFDKEYTDVSTGLSLFSVDQQQYLRLGLVLEDFIYDEKNDRNGISLQTPVGLRWTVRFLFANFIIYSDGKYSRGFDRHYPNRNKSPRIISQSQHIDFGNSRIYYQWNNRTIICLSYNTYLFDEQESFVDSLFNYQYGNDLYDLALEGQSGFNRNNFFRLHGHYLRQRATAWEYRSHCFSRTDYLAGLFYERCIKRSRIEAGYMVSFYNFNYNGLAGQSGYKRNGYIDKLKLGWTYRFPQGARIQLSLSHELSSGEFGGANLQYMMFF
jgi:hypothetical protein